MTESVRFDRAAEYYDRTRSLPAEAQARVTELLLSELDGRGPVLEIGIGTGRMAMPLAEQGVPVLGVDLSAPMIAQLVAKRRSAFPAPLVADATRLPFRDSSVGAVFACHVLHLIPAWRLAVGEAERVLRPGGVLLVDPGGGPGGIWKELADHVCGLLGLTRPRPGMTDISEVDAETAGRLRPRELPPILSVRARTINDYLDEIAAQIHAWTWVVERPTLVEAVDRTRVWAAGAYGDPDVPRPVELAIRWRAYDLVGGGVSA